MPYCTPDDVRSLSQLPAFTEVDGDDEYVVTDEQLTAKISTAELVIDGVAKYWDRLVPTQARVFPRAQDTTGAIPDVIKQATVFQVEFMQVNSPDIDHGIEPDNLPTKEAVSPRVLQLMSAGFIKKTGSITIPQPQSPETVAAFGAVYNGELQGDIKFSE